MTEYQDFSSERSTWFFKIDKEGKNTIFSDFYPPFDPSVKVENFSPIMEYNLDSNYYFNNQNNLRLTGGFKENIRSLLLILIRKR